MRVLIAIDSFKGSATSAELARAASQAVVEDVPNADVHTVLLADGGEGTVDALASAVGGRFVQCRVHGPLGDIVEARYCMIDGEEPTAVMELAAASGLTLVPESERDVMRASTLGTGEMIAHAIAGGARRIVLGVGGSATCDCGMGLLHALGVRFSDASGNVLQPSGYAMSLVTKVDLRGLDTERLQGVVFRVLTDVTNPLYGPEGAAYVFGPQKGADKAHVELLDQGLRAMARLMPEGAAETAGAGAAGGVAGGMLAWLGATLTSGVDEVLRLQGAAQEIADADLVITGEGRVDVQTTMGKGPGVVLAMAREHGAKCVALCGCCTADAATEGFDAVLVINTPEELRDLSTCMKTDVVLQRVRRTMREFLRSFGTMS